MGDHRKAADRNASVGVAPSRGPWQWDGQRSLCSHFGRFAPLHDAERLVPNLHRIYSELKGEPSGTPLNANQMFTEMLTYNGGQPLRCFA